MADAQTRTDETSRASAAAKDETQSSARPTPDARASEAGVPKGQEAQPAHEAVPGDPASGFPPPPVGNSTRIVRQYELTELVRSYDPDADEDLLNRAYVYAMQAHGNQMRQSGDPYFTHPLSVAAILADLKLDPVTIVAALLHDVVEDTDRTLWDIRENFGDDVALLVDGVTKISKRELAPDADGAAENFAKFILATCKDVRTLLVKLADRLHNMRTMHFIKKREKQKRIALETMEIFVPLARMIGIDKLREELEDLSFYYLRPEDYATITRALEDVSQRSVSNVVALSQDIRQGLEEAGIKAEIHSREKRAYSVWRKTERKRAHFKDLADIYAFRLIVENEDDCYRALGVIHQRYPMIPDEFDDYISLPKPNNYRSLHTAVVLSKDTEDAAQKAEVQIRTKEMHDAAERGIAAHWRYKNKGGGSVEMQGSEKYNSYELLRQSVTDFDKGGNASEFLQQAKMEFYRDQIFTFTPRGRVISLPVGSSPLDFAYALHTDIGNSFTGANVNGRHVPNRTTLKNGDVVLVHTAKDAPIPNDWERYVVTGSAKLGLRKRMRAVAAKEQRALGERIIRNIFSVHDVPYSREAVREASKRLGYNGIRSLLEAVGRLEIEDTKVLDEVYPNLRETQRTSGVAIKAGTKQDRRTISIDGIQRGAAITLAACCNPLPGERIVGVGDSDGHVIVHRVDCRVLVRQSEDDWIDLAWKNDPDASFVVEVVVTVTNRTGAIGHIGSLLAKYDADIHDLTVENREVQFSDLRLQIEVSDSRHLANVLTALRGSDFVVAIERSEGMK